MEGQIPPHKINTISKTSIHLKDFLPLTTQLKTTYLLHYLSLLQFFKKFKNY